MVIESEFKVGQFGKIGEHMVGFELSKRGWIIFYPPYDERIDVVAVKFRCKKCKSAWLNEHRVGCLNTSCSDYMKPIPNIRSKEEYKHKKCLSCNKLATRKEESSQKTKCSKCKGNLEEVALCPKCNSEIGIIQNNCSNPLCKSKDYEVVFRSIQVKSSHLVDKGKNLGFNFRYQDLINDKRHFFIVYNQQIVEDIEKHFYWVMSTADFKKVKNTNTTSFKIYQNDRGHYPLVDLKDYFFDEKAFYGLLEKINKTKEENKIDEYNKLLFELKKVDVFRKLD